MNKQQVAQRFGRARWDYDQHALAQQQIIQQLLALLATQKRPFGRVLEIGCGTGMLSEALLQRFQIQHLVLNDLCADYQDCLAQKLAGHQVEYQFGDAEQCDFAGPFDLIISASAVQWFEQPAQFLQKAAKLLKKDGILLFNTFTEQNLSQIKRLFKTGLSYPSQAQWLEYLSSAGFELRHFSDAEIVLVFEQIQAVLAHLANTGVSVLDASVWSSTRLAKLEARYQQQCHSSQLALSYTPRYILACKKGEK